MVFDPQLGYDPEEWEECPPPDHFLAFSFPTRVVLSVVAVLFPIAFFWVLEVRKTWVREDRRESILNLATPLVKEAVVHRRASVAVSRAYWEGTGVSRGRKSIVTAPLPPPPPLSRPLADLERTVEETEERERSRSSSSTHRRGSGKPRTPLTPDEKAQLHEWEREVERVAESRLRAAEKLDCREDKPQLSASRESSLEDLQPIDHPSRETVLSPSHPQSLPLPLKDPLKRVSSSHSRLLECVTPLPSTPQTGIETGVTAAGKKNSAVVPDPQQRRMVADLEERLAEMEALSSCLPQGAGEQPLAAQPAPKLSIVSADFNSGGWAESGDEAAIKSPWRGDSKLNLLLFSSRAETDADQPPRAGGPSSNEKGSRSSGEDEFINVQNYMPDVESTEGNVR